MIKFIDSTRVHRSRLYFVHQSKIPRSFFQCHMRPLSKVTMVPMVTTLSDLQLCGGKLTKSSSCALKSITVSAEAVSKCPLGCV